MNQLETEIRRAFDELVAAAPPPPTAPSSILPFPVAEDSRNFRLLAVAASILVVAAVGATAFVLANDPKETLVPSDPPAPSEGTGPVAASTAPAPTPTEPTLIREVDGGPAPVTSVVLAPFEEYELATAPLFVTATEPVPVEGAAYDGVYFAFLHEGPQPDDPLALRFDVIQASPPTDCSEQFGTPCTDYGIDPNGSVDQLDLRVDAAVITVRDGNRPDHYRISGAELVSLIYGGEPAATAPDGYTFSGGSGYLLTFENGTLTRIDQPADPEPSAT